MIDTDVFTSLPTSLRNYSEFASNKIQPEKLVVGGDSERMSLPKFLDEGTYGCIHRPPLRCASSSKITTYKNKISKLITKKHAEEELSEYKNIQKADPNNLFHLGEPEICPLGPIGEHSMNKNPIEKCTMYQEVKNTPDNYQLILLKDGGNDIDKFLKKTQYMMNQVKKKEMIEKCWIEFHRILKGLHVFLKQNLIHHDVKSTNIVYNVQQNRMNFIDFGMMENIKESIAKCKKDEYEWVNNWWYFPYDTTFLNETNFKQAQSMNKSEISKYVDGNLNKDIWFSTFVRISGLEKSESLRLLEDYKQFLFTDFKKTSHETFLIRYFSTLDIYGLGITFLQVLNNTKKYMNETFNTKLKTLAMKMISFCPNRRILISNCINEYEKILESSGMTQQYNFTFQSHKIVYNVKKNKTRKN